jgi:copper chaperone CopZ
MSEIILTIAGMTCGGCVNSVTRVLQATPGVHKASVSLVPSQALVSYDPALASPEQLAQAVADAGFSVTASRIPAA